MSRTFTLSVAFPAFGRSFSRRYVPQSNLCVECTGAQHRWICRRMKTTCVHVTGWQMSENCPFANTGGTMLGRGTQVAGSRRSRCGLAVNVVNAVVVGVVLVLVLVRSTSNWHWPHNDTEDKR